MTKTVLIADDDVMITQLFHLGLAQGKHDVKLRTAQSGEHAISVMNEVKPDVLVLDIRMPQGDGFTVLDHVKSKEWDMPVIVLTNCYDKDIQDKCRTYGIDDYLVKHEQNFNVILQKVTSRL